MNKKFPFEIQHNTTPSLRGFDRFAIGTGIPWQSAGYERQSIPLADCHNTPSHRPTNQYFAMTKSFIVFVRNDSNII